MICVGQMSQLYKVSHMISAPQFCKVTLCIWPITDKCSQSWTHRPFHATAASVVTVMGTQFSLKHIIFLFNCAPNNCLLSIIIWVPAVHLFRCMSHKYKHSQTNMKTLTLNYYHFMHESD